MSVVQLLIDDTLDADQRAAVASLRRANGTRLIERVIRDSSLPVLLREAARLRLQIPAGQRIVVAGVWAGRAARMSRRPHRWIDSTESPSRKPLPDFVQRVPAASLVDTAHATVPPPRPPALADAILIHPAGRIRSTRSHLLAIHAVGILHLHDPRYRLLVDPDAHHLLHSFATKLGTPTLLATIPEAPSEALPAMADVVLMTSATRVCQATLSAGHGRTVTMTAKPRQVARAIRTATLPRLNAADTFDAKGRS